MPVIIGVSRQRSLQTDNDGDGQPDPGDVFLHTIIVTNSGDISATNVVASESENGYTIDPASLKIGPIAFDDTLTTITGNTPVTFSKASLLGNDQDPDGPEASLVIAGFANVTGGSLVDNGDGTLTFTPTTGFTGNASFTYSITDAQGLSSVATTPGTVTIPVSGLAWYVDKAYAGANGPSDGSYLKPFTDMTSLNGVGGAGDVDGVGDIIFIYDRVNPDVTANIILENNQSLFGDGHALTVNGIAIGASANNSTVDHSGIGVTLASGNTIRGLDLNGTAAAAVGIADGGATVGALTISNTSIAGQGTIFDVDNGGTLNVSLTSLQSTGSSGANGGVIDITGAGGSFTVTGTTTISGTHAQTGIDIGSNNDLAVAFQGLTTVNTAAQGAINLSTNTGTSSMGFAGVDIDTTTGNGLVVNAGGTLTITGASNSINTTSGQILSITNNSLGASGVSFATLGATGSPATSAIILNNVDGNSFSGGNVSIFGTSGASSDGINISGDSSSNFNFTSATIGGAAAIGDEGIELNGANGAVTFGTVTISNTTGNGVEILNATNAVNINAGSIGAAGGDAVNITGGTGAVSIAASVTKTTAGNVVEVNNHETGNVTFSANISATGNVNNGIIVTNSNSGTIAFTGQTINISTGVNAGVSLTTNAGGTINFAPLAGGNGLDITTTTGTGFSATGGGTVSVTGSGNTITAGNGTALNISNTDFGAGDATFQTISSSGGTATGIILDTTGSAGGLHITGTGTAGSGGTIANKTGADGSTTTGIGIYANNTAELQLDRMQLNGFENFAIRLSDVNGFTLSNSVVNGNNGNSAGADEGAILILNSSGTINITGSQISGGFEDNLRVLYDSATPDTATYNITGNTFSDLQSGNNALVNLRSATSASTSSNVTFNIGSPTDPLLGNVFDNSANQNPLPPPDTQWFGDGILVTFEGGFQHNINIDNNTFFELFQAIDYAANFSADVTGRIYSNDITFTEGVAAIAFGTGSSSTSGMLFQLLVEDNIIGGLGNNSGSRLGSGIVGDFRGAETARITIHQNSVQDAEVNPINIISQSAANAQTHLRITNNTVASIDDDEGGGAGVIPGINVTTNAATTGDIFLTMTGNTSTGINEDGILIRQATLNNTFQLEDFAGNGTVAADVDAYLTALNTSTVRIRTGGSVVNYGTMNFNNTNTPAPFSPMLAGSSPPPPPSSPPAKDSGTGGELVPDLPNGGDLGDPVHDVPLIVIPEAAPSHPVIVDDNVLSQAELDYLADAAIQRWADAGASDEQIAAMRATSISVADMTGLYLGTSSTGVITVDADGAGHDWFLDTTPGEDSEYDGSSGRLAANAGGAAEGRMDLLTVLMHELGHQIGLDDIYATGAVGELMYGYAFVGERRVAAADDLAGADPSHIGHTSYVLSPITIGALPATQAVQYQFTSTVNSFANQIIPNGFNNFTTVSGDNFAQFIGANEALTIDSLTLGGTIFADNGAGGGIPNNGIKDGTEAGIDGVALSIFADANNDNAADSPGSPLATAMTAGGGNYSIINLAPGNYIIRVDADNFNAGGNVSLLGLSSSPGSPDPDNNVDNDDNGFVSAGAAFSNSITLAFNTEPTAGVGNDTNNTLDFGFVAVNQAPINTVPGGQTINEDLTLTFVNANSNAISVADADAGSGLLTVTLSVSQGTMTLGGFVGLAFSNGDGTADAAMTFSGSITNINNALQGLVYTPTLNFNGADSLVITTNDNGNTGPDPGLTGGPNDEEDSDSVAITINPRNDPPSGLDDSATIAVDATYVLSAADFNFSDAVEGHAFSALVIATIATDGQLLFDADGPGGAAPTAVVNGQVVTAADLAAGKLIFQPDTGENGTPYATFTFRVRDDGGTANGGNDTDPSPNTFTFNVTASAAPVVDTNGGTAGIDSTANYTEGAGPTVLAAATNVTDADSANLSSATVSITGGFLAGFDVLSAAGAPGGITVSYTAGTGVLTLTGVAPIADYQAALRLVAFNSTSGTPGASRTISWVVNDGGLNSSTAMTALTISNVDDPAVAQDDAFTTDEATAIGAGLNLFNNNGNGADSDPDGPPLSVSEVNGSAANVGSQITLASGALLTVNSDGTFAYNPNGVFDNTPTAGSGASNQPASDSFAYTVAGGDTATVTITINGLDTDDLLLGTPGIDDLDAGVGNDLLDGLAGDDTMRGGLGDDRFVVRQASDAVVELAAEGADRVFTYVDWTLGAGQHVETLSPFNHTVTDAIDLTGNALIQTLYGTAGNNILDGFGGEDSLVGLQGDDWYVVRDHTEHLYENASEGNDRIFSYISYTMAAGLSIETLGPFNHTITDAMDLTGNALVQTLYGTMGHNVLDGAGGGDALAGLGGDDFYVVRDAGDRVFESAGQGNDRVFAYTDWVIAAGAEVETLSTYNDAATDPIDLTGNGLSQTIYGNAGDNRLDGNAGIDALVGLGGNDSYTVWSAFDQVFEAVGGGNDEVLARVSWAMAAGAEIETLSTYSDSSTEAIELTGNGFGQTIRGNAGANYLDGKGGNDSLSGGGGADIFAFTTATGPGNADTLLDMVGGTDKIALDDAVFAGVTSANLANVFVVGPAQDADDRIIYNSGQLFYDADGSGAGAAVLFATVQGAPALASSDFVVI